MAGDGHRGDRLRAASVLGDSAITSSGRRRARSRRRATRVRGVIDELAVAARRAAVRQPDGEPGIRRNRQGGEPGGAADRGEPPRRRAGRRQCGLWCCGLASHQPGGGSSRATREAGLAGGGDGCRAAQEIGDGRGQAHWRRGGRRAAARPMRRLARRRSPAARVRLSPRCGASRRMRMPAAQMPMIGRPCAKRRGSERLARAGAGPRRRSCDAIARGERRAGVAVTADHRQGGSAMASLPR